MRIFTFWEPKDQVPGYIKACLRTWEKAIPNAEVVLLDFDSIREWLPSDIYERVTCRRIPLAKQSDVYRAMLLDRFGGIWMDADTILTPNALGSEAFTETSPTQVTMFRLLKNDIGGSANALAGAFIRAAEPKTDFITRWAAEMPGRVSTFAKFSGNPLMRVFCRSAWRKCRRWDYFENAVIDPLASEMSPSQLKILEIDEFGAFPEYFGRSFCKSHEFYAAYRDYYFTPGPAAHALEISKGIIMLHNSWTPPEFRAMSEDEFLKTDTRLAAILRTILND